MSDRSDTWMPRTSGRIRIHTTEALASTWGMSAKDVGVAWLNYLKGEPSLFEDFCQYKPAAPSDRPHWSVWNGIRGRIFERDGHQCTYCGGSEHLECDHVVPVAKGGGHSDDNLTTACRSCNARKGAKLVEDFAQ